MNAITKVLGIKQPWTGLHAVKINQNILPDKSEFDASIFLVEKNWFFIDTY